MSSAVFSLFLQSRLDWADFTAAIWPAEAQGLQVGEVGEVGQAGNVVVGQVEVNQLEQVCQTLQVFISILNILYPSTTYSYLFDAVLM